MPFFRYSLSLVIHFLFLSRADWLAGWRLAGWQLANGQIRRFFREERGEEGEENLLSIPPRHVESPNKNYRSLFFLTVKLFISERGLFPTNRPFRPLENSNRKQILEMFVKERLTNRLRSIDRIVIACLIDRSI